MQDICLLVRFKYLFPSNVEFRSDALVILPQYNVVGYIIDPDIPYQAGVSKLSDIPFKIIRIITDYLDEKDD